MIITEIEKNSLQQQGYLKEISYSLACSLSTADGQAMVDIAVVGSKSKGHQLSGVARKHEWGQSASCFCELDLKDAGMCQLARKEVKKLKPSHWNAKPRVSPK